MLDFGLGRVALCLFPRSIPPPTARRFAGSGTPQSSSSFFLVGFLICPFTTSKGRFSPSPNHLPPRVSPCLHVAHRGSAPMLLDPPNPNPAVYSLCGDADPLIAPVGQQLPRALPVLHVVVRCPVSSSHVIV